MPPEKLAGAYNGHPNSSTFYIESYRLHALPVERQAIILALVNRQVSEEAAAVFWGQNTFRFLGPWVWDSLVEWLIRIGDVNRGHLKSLEMAIPIWHTVQYVWQLHYPLGARTQLEGTLGRWTAYMHNRREKTYPRNRHLVLPYVKDELDLIGCVDNISPSVETIFELLGQNKTRKKMDHKVTISMLMPASWYPGLSGSGLFDSYYMSMDLPNVMERCRELHTTGEGTQIEVLWKGVEDGSVFDGRRSSLEQLGWDIVSERISKRREFPGPRQPQIFESTHLWFSLRRRRIEGDIAASLPSIYSINYYGDGVPPPWWDKEGWTTYNAMFGIGT